jgi:hypothetical protein
MFTSPSSKSMVQVSATIIRENITYRFDSQLSFRISERRSPGTETENPIGIADLHQSVADQQCRIGEAEMLCRQWLHIQAAHTEDSDEVNRPRYSI